jgi:hypothetical protein
MHQTARKMQRREMHRMFNMTDLTGIQKEAPEAPQRARALALGQNVRNLRSPRLCRSSQAA